MDNNDLEGDAKVSRARHKRASASLRVRSLTRLALPIAVIAAAPVGAVATHSGVTEIASEAPEAFPSLDEFEREILASRGMVDRSAPEELPEALSVDIDADADEEPEDEPEEDEDEAEEDEAEDQDEDLSAAGTMYATAGLNVRTAADTDSDIVTVLARGSEVTVTNNTDGAWVQIIHDGSGAWVHGDFLSEDEPSNESSGGISFEPCPSGSAVESGLTQDAIRVHRAVCAQFPGVDSYGGYRSGGGAHSQGRALDIMTSNRSLGDSIAAWVRENHSALGVSEVIWAQRIWTVERSSEGWRWMEDRGSDTANHYDHVHVTVYGNAGG
jgi:uncharacterized protein YgiM (DUF1202 family)